MTFSRPQFAAAAVACLAAAIAITAGCSHGVIHELPAAPAARIGKLTITPVGGGTMLAGGSAPIVSSGDPSPQSLGALAQYTDGTAKYVAAVWSTSDASVIAIDGTMMRAMGRGTVTVTAVAEGQTARETFKVEPGIGGTWSGTYVIDQCAGSAAGIHDAICGTTPGRQPGVLPVGTAAPIALQITQAGTDLTAIAAFGDIRGTLTGTDRGQNFLTLGGELQSAQGTKLTLVYWDARVRTDVMEGFIAFETRVPGVAGQANVTAHFDQLARR